MNRPRLDKSALRTRLRTLRAEMAARDPDAAARLADGFPARLLERYGPAVAGYRAIGSELDPEPLMRRLEKSGASLALPRIEPDGAMTFRAWSFGEPLEAASFGLLQPPEDAPELPPTLVLVPLLAFDRLGHRLGYGKGHYDRALAGLRSGGRVFACGIAYRAQMVESLPAEAHDEVLDWAATEAGQVPLFFLRAGADRTG